MATILLVAAGLVVGIPLYLLIGRWMNRWFAAYLIVMSSAFIRQMCPDFPDVDIEEIRRDVLGPFNTVFWPILMLAGISACVLIMLAMWLVSWWRWIVKICSE